MVTLCTSAWLYATFEEEGRDGTQQFSVLLFIIAGAIQVVMIAMRFYFPMSKKKDGLSVLVYVWGYLNLTFFVIGCIVLPIWAGIASLADPLLANTHTLWNLVCFINCMYLLIGSLPLSQFIFKTVVLRKHNGCLQHRPEDSVKDVYLSNPSALLGCRADIYQFTWTMCLKESVLKQLLEAKGNYSKSFLSRREFK